MEITITKNNIYDYVLSLTARAGKAMNAYSEIALTEDNYPVLDVYLSSAVTLAEGTLRRKLDQSNGFDLKAGEDSITITIRDLMRQDSSVLNNIESGIRMFLAYHISASWLIVTSAKDYHKPYTDAAMQHLKAVYDALNQKRPNVLEDTEYEDRTDERRIGTTPEADAYEARTDERRIGTTSDSAGNYSERMKDTSVKTAKNNSAEYGRRKKDNVIARPGVRINDHEVLLIRTEDGCGRKMTEDCNKHILMSNQ